MPVEWWPLVEPFTEPTLRLSRQYRRGQSSLAQTKTREQALFALAADLGDHFDVVGDRGVADLGGEQVVDLEDAGRVVQLDLVRTARFSPAEMLTWSIAAAEIE